MGLEETEGRREDRGQQKGQRVVEGATEGTEGCRGDNRRP
jgi:hypothetical protein